MEPISQELVERTWKEFAAFPLEQAQNETAIISKNQPNLLAFMMEFTQELSQEVRKLKESRPRRSSLPTKKTNIL